MATASRPTVDGKHLLFCVGIWAEFLVAFGGLIFVLALGTLYTPMFLMGAVVPEAEATRRSVYLLPVVLVVLGWSGLAGILRLLYLICRRKTDDPCAWVTLSGLAVGVVLLLAYAYLDVRHGLSTWPVDVAACWLPLACTAHFLYLARRALFARPPA